MPHWSKWFRLSNGSTQTSSNLSNRFFTQESIVLVLVASLVGVASSMTAVLLGTAVYKLSEWATQFHGQYWSILFPALGAGLAAWFLRNLLKDHSGHGLGMVIQSAVLRGGQLPATLIFSRLISSLLTVGSGGSAGLEGPVATSGAALGSTTARVLELSERRRAILLGCGVAGAVAGIFNAPLTGTMFSLEVILGEWSAMAVLPCIISAVTATQVSRLLPGHVIQFSRPGYRFSTIDLAVCVLLGVTTGLLSAAFRTVLMVSESYFKRLISIPWLCAVCGGLLVGILGYFVPAVLYDGYPVISRFLNGTVDMNVSGVLLFIAIKFAASCITLGSGGSGGVFAPSLAMGSSTGYLFGLIMRQFFPIASLALPSAFALVGMAGMVAGLMHAPLSGMFLVLEITAGYDMVLPLMIVSACSMLTNHSFQRGSIYTYEMLDQGQYGKRGSDQHLLQVMQTHEMLDPHDVVLESGMLLEEFVERFKYAHRNIFPVIEPKMRKWLGMVVLDDVRPYLFEKQLYTLVTMDSIMRTDIACIETTEEATSAIKKFETSNAWSLPVLRDGEYLGMMSKSTLFDRYRRELMVHTEEE